MPRTAFFCRHCKEPLGEIKPSGVFHLFAWVSITVIDQRRQVTVLRCPKCGRDVQYRGERIEPDQRKSA